MVKEVNPENVKRLTLSDIRDLLKAEVFVGKDKMETVIEGGTASDLMSDMLTGHNSGVVMLTGLCNVQVIRTAVIADVAAVVIVRGKKLTEEMVKQAMGHGLPLLSTHLTMFSSCGKLFSKGLRGVENRSANAANH